MYLSKYFSKNLNLKIRTKKTSKKTFKPETSILRLSNYKSKKHLNWHPKWSINKSLDKIISWNEDIKKKTVLNVCFKQIQEYIHE